MVRTACAAQFSGHRACTAVVFCPCFVCFRWCLFVRASFEKKTLSFYKVGGGGDRPDTLSGSGRDPISVGGVCHADF